MERRYARSRDEIRNLEFPFATLEMPTTIESLAAGKENGKNKGEKEAAEETSGSRQTAPLLVHPSRVYTLSFFFFFLLLLFLFSMHVRSVHCKVSP